MKQLGHQHVHPIAFFFQNKEIHKRLLQRTHPNYKNKLTLGNHIRPIYC